METERRGRRGGFGGRRGGFGGRRGGFGGRSFPPKPVEVGKEYDVEIQETSRRGEGIARIKGLVCFVKNTKPGDHVKIRIVRISRRFAEGEVVGEGAPTETPEEAPSVTEPAETETPTETAEEETEEIDDEETEAEES